ncbi:MAG: MG2 domain-containing protein, partial [Pseudomonadota bacterium]
DGIANLPGSDVLDPENILRHVWRDDAQRLFVRVEKDADIALLPIANSYLIDTSRVTDYKVDSTLEKIHGHMKSWGMTAQGIYHAGDNLQYKIYVRDQGNNGFIQPPEGEYKLAIVDPMGHQVKTIDDVRLDAFGAYAGEYTVPKSSPVGWYDFKLTYFKQGDKNTAIATPKQNDKGEESSEDKGIELHPMRVLVSDFTPAPFHVRNEIKGTHFQAGDTVDVSTLAQLHSGGAYGDAAVRVTATLNAAPFISKDIVAEGFQFDSFKEEESSKDIFQKADKLDGKGGWQTFIIIPDSKIVYGTLRIESAVQDDRGKSVAGSNNVEYVGVDRLVGLKSTK